MLRESWIAFVFLAFHNALYAMARTRCARVQGRLTCPTDPDRHFNILVKLLDKDPLPWETDDLMGVGYTDIHGNYTVSGCGNDLGSWNDPDPYIFVEHRCPEPGHTISITHRYKTIELNRVFLPEEIFVKSVRIDERCDNC